MRPSSTGNGTTTVLMLGAVWFVFAFAMPAFAQERQRNDPVTHWARVLTDFVNDRGEVNFRGLAKNQSDLDAFIAYIAKTSPESSPESFPTRESRLAYHLNAYNALSMWNVIDSGIPRSLSGPRKVWFFGFKKVQVGGRSMSLYAYENEVIRPMGDERVHFALNCMSVGCPRLPRVPFTARDVDDQLERKASRFFAEPRNLQRVPERNTVRLSAILSFYTEDFLRRSPSLIAYVNRHLRERIPENYKIEFIDYDWTVNGQRRKSD